MKKQEYSMIPYQTIEQAINGDVLAINEVLKHYHSYINKLSQRVIKNELGKRHMVVDEILRNRIESRLLKTILSFKIRQ